MNRLFRWLKLRLFPGWRWHGPAALVLVLSGCAATQREACTPDRLARIEAECVAQIVGACSGAPAPSSEGDAEQAVIAVCPAAEAIFAECQEQRDEWVKCNG